MADLLALSERLITTGDVDTPPNRVTGELSEVAEGLAVVEAFSHVWALATDDGLVVFDTSVEAMGAMCRDALRRWSDDPVHTIVYTHGHIDHVGGARAFVAEAEEAGRPRPRIVAHDRVLDRFRRYDLTNGYNAVINARQFGRTRLGMADADSPSFFSDWVRPDTTFDDRLRLDVGGLELQLRHDRGETDDHAWVWVPERRAIFSGDFLTWVFPNAGNPQKVQRYPVEWAAALRSMQALEPELLLPAHGLPIAGRDLVAEVLGDAASALETLVRETLARMNAGARLDEIVHAVRLPAATLAKPYLRPIYDEPEFVVRNIWRLYGGWYDGNPAELKPAPEAAVAGEVAALAGGPGALAERGRALAAAGDEASLRLACHLVEWAAQAAPDDGGVHAARAEVYLARRTQELSLMAKGIYGAAAADSQALAGPQ